MLLEAKKVAPPPAAKAVPREAVFDRSAIFDNSFLTHLERAPSILGALEAFQAAKRRRPPEMLPRGMRDHTLGPPLDGFRECHLAPDSCLIYTDRADKITLIAVVSHDEMLGRRAKALLKQIGSYRT